MNDLENNKIYMIQNEHYEEWNLDYFESLKPLVFTHTTHRMDDGIRYYFEDPLTDYRDSVDQWSIKNYVFENTHQFLKYTVMEAKRITKPIGIDLQKIIDESKEDYPEEWV